MRHDASTAKYLHTVTRPGCILFDLAKREEYGSYYLPAARYVFRQLGHLEGA